jgi:molecular chaperone IbpA
MRSYDFSPLFRSGVGFERMVNALESVSQTEQQAYPEYNIEQLGDDQFSIALAVPGYSPTELTLETRDSVLTVAADPNPQDATVQYLHRGFAKRGFKKTFHLADYIRVEGARLEHGVLHVDLRREVPERMRPRRVPIGLTDERASANPTLSTVDQSAA